MSYFELGEITTDDRWVLGSAFDAAGQRISFHPLATGKAVDPEPFRDATIEVHKAGTILDVTLGNYFVPIVRHTVAELIGEIAKDDVQRLPIRVTNTNERFEIINILHRLDCVDEQQSVLDRYGPDYPDPSFRGDIKLIRKLVVDPKRIGNAKIFRIKPFARPVFLHQELAQALRDHDVTGLTMREIATTR